MEITVGLGTGRFIAAVEGFYGDSYFLQEERFYELIVFSVAAPPEIASFFCENADQIIKPLQGDG